MDMDRPYRDDTTVDDIRSCDQIELVCPCGHKVGPAFALWPRPVRLTPLRDLHRRFVCERCGRRAPAIVISAYGGEGGRMKEVWRWPRPA